MSWQDVANEFGDRGMRDQSMAEEIVRLRGLEELHHRTISLVFPGERDSPGAYMKILRDTEKALSISQERVMRLLKIIRETEQYLHWKADELSGDDLIGDGRLTASYQRTIRNLNDALESIK